MPRSYIKLILIPVFFILASCSFLLRTYYGISNPELESSASLSAFAKECKLDNGQLFHLDSSAGITAFSYYLGYGLPGIRIYNRQGDMIKMLNEKECPHLLSGVIKSLLPGAGFDTIVPGFLESDLGRIRRLDEEKIALRDLDASGDYFVLIITSKFMGKKMQRNSVLEWKDSILANAKSRIELLYLFNDIHDSWSSHVLDSLGARRPD